mmetsp:Transcript_15771/g.30485  ORF Transcript_15771/g.30485 Transcript_15771/m.30485 type:complete len:395 (-) Transcript_15771:258-1442(-)
MLSHVRRLVGRALGRMESSEASSKRPAAALAESASPSASSDAVAAFNNVEGQAATIETAAAASPNADDAEPDAKRARTESKRSRAANTRNDPENVKKIDKAWKDVFGHLHLDEVSLVGEIGRTRPRNHVNPLAQQFLSAVAPPVWSEVFADPSLPLFVDIGCAQGRFGLLMAADSKWKEWNHLGLEIRLPHVTRANAWVQRKGFTNAHYVHCSANASVGALLSSYPGPVDWVAVQFPDPHFKRKHHKRRVVQPEFLEDIARNVPKGCKLFMQSDIEEVVAQMRDRADGCSFFDRVGEYTDRDSALDPEVCRNGSDDSLWTRSGQRAAGEGDDEEEAPEDFGDWLKGPNPVGVPTEREVQNQALDLPVYRCLFERNEKDVPPPSLDPKVTPPAKE